MTIRAYVMGFTCIVAGVVLWIWTYSAHAIQRPLMTARYDRMSSSLQRVWKAAVALVLIGVIILLFGSSM